MVSRSMWVTRSFALGELVSELSGLEFQGGRTGMGNVVVVIVPGFQHVVGACLDHVAAIGAFFVTESQPAPVDVVRYDGTYGEDEAVL
jgi:hypothetical protein